MFKAVTTKVGHHARSNRTSRFWASGTCFKRTMDERKAAGNTSLRGAATANGRPRHASRAGARSRNVPALPHMNGALCWARVAGQHGLRSRKWSRRSMGFSTAPDRGIRIASKRECRESVFRYIKSGSPPERNRFLGDSTTRIHLYIDTSRASWWILRQFWIKTCTTRATRSARTARAEARRLSSQRFRWRREVPIRACSCASGEGPAGTSSARPPRPGRCPANAAGGGRRMDYVMTKGRRGWQRTEADPGQAALRIAQAPEAYPVVPEMKARSAGNALRAALPVPAGRRG